VFLSALSLWVCLFSYFGTHVVKQDELVSPAAIEIADSVEDAVPDQGGEKLLNEESQKTTADDGQVQVVDLERTVQLEGRAAPHELTAAQNDSVVYNERNDRLFVRRHDGAARHEAELLGRVAKHLLPCGREDGPEGDTERTVESREADLEVLECGHDCVCVVMRLLRGVSCFVRVSIQREAADEFVLVVVACSRLNSCTASTGCASRIAGLVPTLSKGAT
jgi:hypothetical protein